MMKRYFFCMLLSACTAMAAAQESERPVTSSGILLTTPSKGDVMMPFSIQAEGKRFTPTWGLDMAWEDANNVRRGINHMGKENIGIGRTSFRTAVPMTDATTLAADHTSHLRTRSNAFDEVSSTLPLVMNSDCEAGVHSYYSQNNRANIDHWCQMLSAHVQWMLDNTQHPILGVSPFNEPDFSIEQGSQADFRDIAKKLKAEYPLFSERIVCGGNTLNCDKALSWYSQMSDYLDWGNTHQLAGSFHNYAQFFEKLVADGKVACNDEMHNVGEAMIGLEYGMSVGIWWGFDSRARGEFCDISRHGVRLSYGEHRNNWTAASVYRHDETGSVKAFIGSSERQAVTTVYQFLSVDKPVYFDGYGPVYEWKMELPGGNGYQKGQTNAERVIDVTWGADVQPYPINGDYIIMNKASLRVVSAYGTLGSNTKISQTLYTGKKTQQWSITPVDSRVGGDYSFYDIVSANDQRHIDVLNHSLEAGGSLIAWANNSPSDNEQWYLEYAGDGFFYIRNRLSALYMTLKTNNKNDGTDICQQPLLTEQNRNRQLWRIIPVKAKCELRAPAQPEELTATAHPAYVELQWKPNTENDLAGYMVLRAEAGTGEWNTIARQLTTTRFVDNTCRQGCTYEYCVKAIDISANQSQLSDIVSATPSGAPAMLGRWEFDDDCLDQSGNWMDPAIAGTSVYDTDHKSGTKSLNLSGTQYLQLPPELPSTDALTVALWINWRNSNLSGQRIFDFGSGADRHFYLAPTSSGLHFGIQNGADEQTVDAAGARLSTYTWRHVAVTVSPDKTTIYMDGQEVGSATGLTIRPGDVRPVLNYIGRSLNPSANNLRACIDDLRFFNYALDAEAVKQVMDNTYTGISRASESSAAVPVAYYSTDGRQQVQLRRGLNIIRYDNGETRKSIKK